MDYKQFLDKEGLAHFNHILNERFQGRFKYIGEFELNSDFVDFNTLVPAHVGDVYHAKEGTAQSIMFGDVEIKADDWFVVTNESRFDKTDPTVILVHENDEATSWEVGNVKIEKLGSQMDNLTAYGYYNALNSVAPYAYEAHYDDLNYPYAYENFDDVVASTGGCSAIRVGNEFGRNLDWIYNEQVDFVVHTSGKGGRYETLGLCGQISELNKDFVASREYASEYVLLPFYCVDGINEKHVFVSMNVMPDDPTTPTEILPDNELYASICANMIPRYILDYCGSADEAIECITHHLKIHFSDKSRESGFLPHYLIGDNDKTYVVEFVGENVVATLVDNDSAVMTNFRIAGTTPNADGKYNTPENKATGLPSVVNGLDAHSVGVERFNAAKGAIGLGTDIKTIIKDLHYTNTYKNSTSPFWYSEFVGMSGTTIDSDTGDFATAIATAVAAYNNRSRDPEDANYGTWQSKHTCVYDIDGLKLVVSFQEEDDAYEFMITEADAMPEGENDGDALIYVNGKWKIMPKYGYTADAGNSYAMSMMMSERDDGRFYCELDKELNFVEGSTYEVKIGDEPVILATAILAKNAPVVDEDESGDDVILYVEDAFELRKSTGGNSYIISSIGETENHVSLSIEGQFDGDVYKIDEKYLNRIIEEVDVLPTADERNENRIYKILTPWRKIGAYTLNESSIEDGWVQDASGIHSIEGDFTWDEINFDWDSRASLFTSTAGGPVYRFKLLDNEDTQIVYRNDGEDEPKIERRISLYIYDDINEVFKEIYNSDTSVVGGVDNYSNLRNKPKINGVQLENDKTSTDLKIAVNITKADYDALVLGNVVDPETLYCIVDGDASSDVADYEMLENKPSLEGVEFRQGMNYADLGLMGRSEIEAKLSSFLTFRGSVVTVDDLPDDAERGDVYFVEALQRNYAFNGLQWYDMGGTVDMSIYQKKQGDTLTTTNKSIEGAINELDSLKLEKKPDGLGTEAQTVVGAINELNEKIDEAKQAPLIYVGTASSTSGTLTEEQINDLKLDDANTIVKWDAFYFFLAYHSGNSYWFRTIQTVSSVSPNYERSRVIKIDASSGAWTLEDINLEPLEESITVSSTSGSLTDEQVKILKKNRYNTVLKYSTHVAHLSTISSGIYYFQRVINDAGNNNTIVSDTWKLDTANKTYALTRTTEPVVKTNSVTVTSADTAKYVISSVVSYQIGKMVTLSFVIKFVNAVSANSLQTVGTVNVKPIFDCTGNNWYCRTTGNAAQYFNASCGINRSGSIFFSLPQNTKWNAGDTTFCNFTYIAS